MERAPTIFFVQPHADISGGNKTVFRIASYLAERGHSVRVLTEGGRLPGWIDLRAPIGRKEDWLHRVRETDTVVFTWDYDIDYVLSVPGRKCYYVMHFVHYLEDIFKLPLDMFVAETTFVQRHTYEAYGVQAYRIPIGIDHHLFHFVPQGEKVPNRVMTISRGGEWKGFAEVAQAVRRAEALWGRPIDFRPVAGLTPEQIAREYAEAAIYISGSWYEGTGIPLLEAMASGCAVVTTESKGIDDFAFHEESCLKVPVHDVEGMARALVRLLNDGGLRKRLAENGARIAQEYRWERTVDGWEALLGLAPAKSWVPRLYEPLGEQKEKERPKPGELDAIARSLKHACAEERRRGRGSWWRRATSPFKRVLGICL
ncbi:MAG: glycosyltransferase family 4 protein [Chloroflexi bacterium]|nr:glycosyltransferase family 4 protein [Chloroflexota bacterium]